MKICKECEEKKPLSGFYKQGKNLFGKCKECIKRRVRNNRALKFDQYSKYEKNRYKQNENRRKRLTKSAKEWRLRYPEAYKAQTAVGNALRDGKIIKEPCSFCNSTSNVHAHHNDYSKPLDVVWLCAKCHHRIHAKFPQIHGHHAKKTTKEKIQSN